MITLDEVVEQLLCIERKTEPTLMDKVRGLSRQNANKLLHDENELQKQEIISLGEQSKSFLETPYYKKLVEPYIRSTIMNGLQQILFESDKLTENQLRSIIASMTTALRQIAVLKRNMINGENLKKGMI